MVNYDDQRPQRITSVKLDQIRTSDSKRSKNNSVYATQRRKGNSGGLRSGSELCDRKNTEKSEQLKEFNQVGRIELERQREAEQRRKTKRERGPTLMLKNVAIWCGKKVGDYYSSACLDNDTTQLRIENIVGKQLKRDLLAVY